MRKEPSFKTGSAEYQKNNASDKEKEVHFFAAERRKEMYLFYFIVTQLMYGRGLTFEPFLMISK